MSDITPGPVPPIPADPPIFSSVVSTGVMANVAADTHGSASGNAGISEYAGDLGKSLVPIIPAKARAFIYPIGFAVSLVAVSLSLLHVIDPTAAGVLMLGAQAFTNGLASGNVNK